MPSTQDSAEWSFLRGLSMIQVFVVCTLGMALRAEGPQASYSIPVGSSQLPTQVCTSQKQREPAWNRQSAELGLGATRSGSR